MSFASDYIAAGNDFYAAFARVDADETMLMELMGMFLEDERFGQLTAAIASGDCEKAFGTAHGLKGSTGVLGMNGLYAVLVEMTEHLRRGELDGAKALFPAADREYAAVTELIRSHL